MDPGLKTWKRELVCDRCRRWASALTLIRPGDTWNGSGAHPGLVGKRLCYTCMARVFRLGPPGPARFASPVMVPESILIVSTAVVFLISLFGRFDPTIPGLLFIGSLGFVALDRELRKRFVRRWVVFQRSAVVRRRVLEAWKARKPPDPPVNIDMLFEEHSS